MEDLNKTDGSHLQKGHLYRKVPQQLGIGRKTDQYTDVHREKVIVNRIYQKIGFTLERTVTKDFSRQVHFRMFEQIGGVSRENQNTF